MSNDSKIIRIYHQGKTIASATWFNGLYTDEIGEEHWQINKIEFNLKEKTLW
jgi:hypothetical protein